MKIASIGRFLARLSDQANWAPTVAKLLKLSEATSPTFDYAELYVDETGSVEDGNLALGGLLIFYSSPASAEVVDERLSSEWLTGEFRITRKGRDDLTFDGVHGDTSVLNHSAVTLSFRGPNRLPKQLKFGRGGVVRAEVNGTMSTIRPEELREQLAREFTKTLKGQGAIALFSCAKMKSASDIVRFPDYAEHDRLFHYLLTQLLRHVFGVFCAPYIAAAGFFVATRERMVPFTGPDADSLANAAADTLFFRFGIRPQVRNGRLKFRSVVAGPALGPLVFAAESYFAGFKGVPKTTAARADTLHYGTGTFLDGTPDENHQHRRQMYYADEMLTDFGPYERAGVDYAAIDVSTMDDMDPAIGVLESSRHLLKEDLPAAGASLYAVYLREGSQFFDKTNPSMFVAAQWTIKILTCNPTSSQRRDLLTAMLARSQR